MHPVYPVHHPTSPAIATEALLLLAAAAEPWWEGVQVQLTPADRSMKLTIALAMSVASYCSLSVAHIHSHCPLPNAQCPMQYAIDAWPHETKKFTVYPASSNVSGIIQYHRAIAITSPPALPL